MKLCAYICIFIRCRLLLCLWWSLSLHIETCLTELYRWKGSTRAKSLLFYFIVVLSCFIIVKRQNCLTAPLVIFCLFLEIEASKFTSILCLRGHKYVSDFFCGNKLYRLSFFLYILLPLYHEAIIFVAACARVISAIAVCRSELGLTRFKISDLYSSPLTTIPSNCTYGMILYVKVITYKYLRCCNWLQSR